MKIIIDVGHPGDFYLFKNLSEILLKKGHDILFTVREGEFESEHLSFHNFQYKIIGKKKGGKLGKIVSILIFTLKVIFISFRFKPTHFVSHGSLFAGVAAFIFRKPHIALEDTGNMEQIRLSKPFSDVIISPDVLPLNFGHNHIKISGYHELCYLSPKYFNPDKRILSILDVHENEPYAILRFTAWRASHDFGKTGLSAEEKIALYNLVSKYMKVFISAERELPKILEPYRIKIPVTRMHDALYFANMYIGEGATMAAEAGILGTPSIYISPIRISYTEDQEEYGTVFNFTNYEDAKGKINEILNTKDYKTSKAHLKEIIFQTKIDVTAFLVWFLENYPASAKTMREKPDFQYRFK